MRKNLLITLDWPPSRGGVANYLWNVYSRLPHDFSVILAPPLISPPAGGGARGGGSVDELTPPRLPLAGGDNIVVYRRELLGSFWPKWLKAYFEALKIIKTEKIGAVHVSHILPMGYAAWMIKKVLGIPYVVYLHGMDIMLTQKSPWKKFWAKNILREADLIIANGEFTRKEAQKIINREISILYPCPNIAITRLSAEASAQAGIFAPACPVGRDYTDTDKNIILSVGRLVERKGFDKVIEAMPEILRAAPDAECQIVGDGPYAAELKTLAEKSGVSERVRFFHHISDTDLPEFYKSCKIFAMPARKIGGDVEGFGIVYLEAALFGKPSVAGNTGGAPEAVLDGKTGIVVNPESVDEIAAAIVKLLTDDNLRTNLGKAAHERVLSEFTWENQINKIIARL